MSSPEVMLTGLHVTLRPLKEADIARLVEIVNEPGVREWWFDYDEERMRRETLGDDEATPFAIEQDGEFIGLIMYTEELDPYYKFAMIDVTVTESRTGQGLGTDALRTLVRFLIDVRGHHHIMIDPAATNSRAIAAYRKVGFKPVGVMRCYEMGPDGEWRDALLMDLLAEELT